MIKTALKNSESGKDLLSQDNGDGPLLVTTSYGEANGHFKAETLTVAGAVTVINPLPGDAVVLTDLILTTDKTVGSTATVKLTDGVNEVIIISADMVNAPVVLAIPFKGRWQGWKSAGVELEIVGGTNPTATLAIGYYHVDKVNALQFSEWDAQRL